MAQCAPQFGGPFNLISLSFLLVCVCVFAMRVSDAKMEIILLLRQLHAFDFEHYDKNIIVLCMRHEVRICRDYGGSAADAATDSENKNTKSKTMSEHFQHIYGI